MNLVLLSSTEISNRRLMFKSVRALAFCLRLECTFRPALWADVRPGVSAKAGMSLTTWRGRSSQLGVIRGWLRQLAANSRSGLPVLPEDTGKSCSSEGLTRRHKCRPGREALPLLPLIPVRVLRCARCMENIKFKGLCFRSWIRIRKTV